MEIQKENELLTAGGRIRCPRCQAMSKRTKLQCKLPALRSRQVCKYHGGRSPGPRTAAGRQRCAEAKFVHGRETRAKRKRASELSTLLKYYAALLGVQYRTDIPIRGSLKPRKR